MNGEKAISVESGRSAMLPPRGISVLIMDGDSTCLVILSKMLRWFGYEDELDIILAETHLPDMDKYELLETVREMSKLPVIFMSADDNENDMLGALFKGADFYLVKPISMSDIKNLWQFAFTKKTDKMVATEGVSSISSDDTDNHILPNKWKKSHQDPKRKEATEVDKNVGGVNDDASALKKQKLTWTSELHNKFLQAVRVLGIDGAHPKKILQHMNVPGLKKENISSHLQKYRLSLKREQDAIGKTVNRDYSESQVALCNLSSTSNIQGGLFQFPEMQTMTACHQPEFGIQEQKNDVNCCILVPSVGSIHFLNNGGWSCNDTSDCKYEQLAPAINQLDFSYPCSRHARIGITSNEKLAGFHQMVKSNGEELLIGKMASSINVDSRLDIGMQVPSSLTQQEEKDQQWQKNFPPGPAPLHPEEYDVYGAGKVELDMKK